MKPELQRIESTLYQLAQDDSGDFHHSSTAVASRDDASMGNFRDSFNGKEPSFSISVTPFPGQKQNSKTPTLPKFKSASFSVHRHSANPALAMNLLQEIEGIVSGWQNELHRIVRQIQDIYMDGPIVEGWLESHAREPEVDMAQIRRAEVDRLMDYVAEPLSDQNVTCESPRAGYRLCGLDADGQVWVRSCPADQVPSISLAIARYQKLRQLLTRKNALETRLSQLAETLAVLHAHLSND